MYFANEITKNVDAYRLSTYFYKEKDCWGGRFDGAWWDYNLGFGNSDGCDSYLTYSSSRNHRAKFFFTRFGGSALRRPQLHRAHALHVGHGRSDIWATTSIDAIVDSLATLLEDPQRDHTRWPGQSIRPNVFIGQTYDEEVEFLRGWIHDRMANRLQRTSRGNAFKDAPMSQRAITSPKRFTMTAAATNVLGKSHGRWSRWACRISSRTCGIPVLGQLHPRTSMAMVKSQ